MKKIITLLFCTAMLSSAFAQRNDRDDWKNDRGRSVYQNTRSTMAQRDQVIQRINREYDFKIQQVSYDRQMNRREKKRAIKYLQDQRAQKIKRTFAEYNNRYVYSNNRNHDDGNDGRNYGNRHGKNYDNRDGKNYDNRDGRNYDNRDGRNYDNRDGRNYGNGHNNK